MGMGDLSQHFSRKEFECRCCGRLQLDSHLVEGLEALRTLAAVPVVINAGYRCPHHNQEVGGVPNSEHTWGASLLISGCPGSRCGRCTNWRRGYRNLPMAVLGYDGDFLHVDVRGHRAGWARVRGAYVGIEQLVREPDLLAGKASANHVG
jgi:uncharacterized protein YcbK (DUF882 family)